MLLVCVIASAALCVYANPNARRFMKRAARREFRKNPNAPQTSDDLSRALSLGLIYCEEIGGFANGVATGLSANRLDLELKKWGIGDRSSAVSTLDWLRQSGDRAFFDDILLLALKYANRRERQNAAAARYAASAPLLSARADRLAKAVARKKTHPDFPIDQNSLKKGILAWDASRLVVVARFALEKGYIKEETALALIKNAYDATIARYDNWREFANGYLIGAALVSGAAKLNLLYSIAKSALKSDSWSASPLKNDKEKK